MKPQGIMIQVKVVAIAMAMLAMGMVSLSAQTFTTLYNFTAEQYSIGLGYPTNRDGTAPQGELVLLDNTLYGTASGGGFGNGTVFAVNTDGTGFAALHNFAIGGIDGAIPYAGLVLSGGTLYGTAYQGPGFNGGTVFSMNKDGTYFTNLHIFSGISTNSDGATPHAELVLSDNTLYGTAERGGSFGVGTVFRVNKDGSCFTNLHSFTAYSYNPLLGYSTNSDGANPVAGLVLSGNTLYGTTSQGGSWSRGTVFSVNTDGTGFTNLHSFTAASQSSGYSNSDGVFPMAGLVLSDNTLYGTAELGGSSGQGTVFTLKTDGTGFTTLHNFSANQNSSQTNSDGASPQARLVLYGGILYGTTYTGGSSGQGTVFGVNTDGTSFKNLYNFTALKYNGVLGFSTNYGGANPFAGLILSGGILYGTALQGGSFHNGTVFALSLAPNAPIITTQPQSQTALVGNDVSFSIVANGLPLPNYQWQFNGQNLDGQTVASLSLTNVQFANAGGYSVVVTNTYGSITSSIAYLTVLGDGASGKKTVPIKATLDWSKFAGETNLVFITHGWQPVEFNPFGPPAQPWMAVMTNAIAQKLGNNSTWQFETYDWTWAAWTLEPQQALWQAQYIGTQLGQLIATMGFQEVHLIAHSAGSGMIQAIADQLQSLPNPPKIHLTFLDPYLGIFAQEQNNYGKNSDWADNYFAEDVTGGFTGGYLNHAYNADVSWIDPSKTTAPYLGFGGGEVALSSHGYPIDFYIQSITNTDPNWCGAGYGFALSQEMRGFFWINNQTYNPAGSGPVLPCSPSDAVQNPNAGVAGTESVLGDTWLVIADIPNAVSAAGASIIGGAGFVLNSLWSVVPHVQSGGVQPKGGPVSTNIPAWLAMGLTITNAVNYVQFDAAFTDANAAQGLLTVYWNTNQIGMVDERVAATGLQTYRFTLPNTVASGVYTLSFRLDSFNNSSSLAVTNVATGFVGVTQPITLDIPLVNGKPMPRLTAPAGYDYLVQTSTNLVDWTTTALLANTNGTVSFNDSMLASSSQRFYRAVMYSPIAAGQLLQVGLNPVGAVSAGAMWQVDGGAWHTNGASVPSLTTGNHTVAFNTVSGWNSPVSQTVTIYNNAVTITSGTYVQQPGSLKTTITPAGAISAGALWRVDGSAWQNSGTTVNGLTVGNLAVLFSTIGGWTKPASQSAAIYANQITTTNGNYVLIADSTKPTCQITAPTAGLLVSNNNFTITGTAADNVFLAGVRYQLNGAGWNPAATGNGWTNWTAPVSLIPLTNIIQACAVDAAGNVSATNSVSFICILNTPLTVSTNGLGSIAPNYNGQSLTVGQNYSVTATAGTGFSFSNWTGGINLPSTVLTNGATLKFVMQSNLCLQANFRDSAKPTLTVTSPKSLSTVSTSMATVIGTANDNWSLAGVWCKSNSGTWVLATTSDNFTNWTAQVPMVSGINTIKSYAQDSAGNFSTTNSLTVTH